MAYLDRFQPPGHCAAEADRAIEWERAFETRADTWGEVRERLRLIAHATGEPLTATTLVELLVGDHGDEVVAWDSNGDSLVEVHDVVESCPEYVKELAQAELWALWD